MEVRRNDIVEAACACVGSRRGLAATDNVRGNAINLAISIMEDSVGKPCRG